MKTPITILFVSITVICVSQNIDYRQMRDTICPPLCGWRDSLSLTEIIPKMLALDTNDLTANSRYAYFDDLAQQEYMLYAYTVDTNLMRSNATHNMMAVHHNAKAYGAYWNTAFAFYKLGDCGQMLHWLNLYEELIPRKYLDKAQRRDILSLKSNCK